MNVNSSGLLNQRKAALTAGVALLMTTAASLFAYGVIHTQLIKLNDIPK
jgi:large exoprotein involved in heme utilization and adhesion